MWSACAGASSVLGQSSHRPPRGLLLLPALVRGGRGRAAVGGGRAAIADVKGRLACRGAGAGRAAADARDGGAASLCLARAGIELAVCSSATGREHNVNAKGRLCACGRLLRQAATICRQLLLTCAAGGHQGAANEVGGAVAHGGARLCGSGRKRGMQLSGGVRQTLCLWQRHPGVLQKSSTAAAHRRRQRWCPRPPPARRPAPGRR